MLNERLTEAIVREHFQAFTDDVLYVEEQQSTVRRIRRLLRTASKSGSGRGYPDFLISLKNEPDLLIVIECKADVQKHCSEDFDHYADYAVDGARLYAEHLSRDFDVLSIGVSGTSKQNLQVSHFLHLKGQRSPFEIFGDILLPPSDYVQGYLNSPEKYRQDFETLQCFIRDLNKRLHIDRVLEGNRSLLISAILIALERESFKRGFSSEHDPKRLAEMVIDAVDAELKDANVSSNRLPILRQSFGFLSSQPVLTTEDDKLRSIIEDIDKEVNSFIKNHKYRDVLGTLYIEFLRYSNSDKSLGIVLTPPHITEFFTDIAQVNANSVVYDNCTGTGGFLISAMKRMIEDADGAQDVVNRIKSDQLYGVEQQPLIYSLAVSNMYIHQDGKSNIFLGDCFDECIMQEIISKRPSVGLLNPPYKIDKRNDTEELSFVINNLECLSQGGICVAIVPMSVALAQSGDSATLKERLLKNHTLEAVFSMPDELFFNSNVSVVSCVMVFTAHRPHPKDKNVFLGYFKDDGFIKQRLGGRIDANRKWDDVKKQWLHLYTNRIDHPGLSVNVPLTPFSEWAAEAYMETDYSELSDSHFQETLFEYSKYLFSSRQKTYVSHDSLLPIDERPSLETDSWKWFNVSDLFKISGSKTTSLTDLKFLGTGKYPYVTTQTTDNGVRGFYNFLTERGGC